MAFKKYAFGALVLSLMLTVLFIAKPYADNPKQPYSNGFPDDPQFTGTASGKSANDYSPMDFQYQFLSSFDDLTKLIEGQPIRFPFASDPEGSPGMSLTRTWNEQRFGYGIGRPDVVIAYVEGGIKLA